MLDRNKKTFCGPGASGRHKGRNSSRNQQKILYREKPNTSKNISQKAENKSPKSPNSDDSKDQMDYGLRPTPPLAPNNSTQFIMDNHETSSLFVNFDDGSHPKSKNSNEGSNPGDWLPFNFAEYETEYRSAREDKMTAFSHNEMKRKILMLEAKGIRLNELLAASPSRLLAGLQSQLLSLQEENKDLKSENEMLKCRVNVRGSVSSSSDSSGSSTSSSSTSSDSESDSSFSGLDEDTEMLTNGEHEDEKENTQPDAT